MKVEFLQESVLLGNRKELVKFLKTDCKDIAPDLKTIGWAGHPLVIANRPFGGYSSCCYYPDGSESKWFYAYHHLFISGMMKAAGHIRCFVNVYCIDGKSIEKRRIFGFFNDFDRTATKPRRKEMANFMRNLMRKSSSFSSPGQIIAFLQDEEKKNYDEAINAIIGNP